MKLSGLDVINFINQNRSEIANAIREIYRDSLQNTAETFDKKLLIYNNKLICRNHTPCQWSYEETYSEAFCIYRVQGAKDSYMDDEAVNYLMKNFDVDKIINNIISCVYTIISDECLYGSVY